MRNRVLRFLLDTDAISEAHRPSPGVGVVGWLSAQIDDELMISTLSLGEMLRVTSLAPSIN